MLDSIGFIPTLLLSAILLIAAVKDIRFHKIPNWLTYSSMGIALLYHTGLNGLEGLLFSLKGIGIGMGLLIFFYLMKGMGAGDVKLLGAVGGLLGPTGVALAFLWTAVLGGIYALGLLVFHLLNRTDSEKREKPKLCYGVVIAAGTFLSVYWRILILQGTP